MKTSTIEKWTLEAKIETWDLLLSSAKILGLTLSPVVTSAYSYMHKCIIHNPKIDLDLMILSITTMFINIKSEYSDKKVESIIKAFSKLSPNLTARQTTIFGNTTNTLKQLAKNPDDLYQLNILKTNVFKTELVMLTLNNWEFETDHPFSPLIHILEVLRQDSPKDKVETFRSMRAASVKNLITLIVTCEGEFPPSDILSGAAITNSMASYPDLFQTYKADNWYDICHFTPETIQSITSLSQTLNSLKDRVNGILSQDA